MTNADLAPTILEAAGAKPGRTQDGRSLFPLLEDRGLEWGRDLLIEGAPGVNQPAFDALRTYRYVYVQHANGERELYDLERDPYQLTNLVADPAYAGVQAELSLRLGLLSVCVGRSCRVKPAARLAVRAGCKARVSGSGVESVLFRSARRLRQDRAQPVRLPSRWKVAASPHPDERRAHRHARPVAASALPLRAVGVPKAKATACSKVSSAPALRA